MTWRMFIAMYAVIAIISTFGFPADSRGRWMLAGGHVILLSWFVAWGVWDEKKRKRLGGGDRGDRADRQRRPE